MFQWKRAQAQSITEHSLKTEGCVMRQTPWLRQLRPCSKNTLKRRFKTPKPNQPTSDVWGDGASRVFSSFFLRPISLKVKCLSNLKPLSAGRAPLEPPTKPSLHRLECSAKVTSHFLKSPTSSWPSCKEADEFLCTRCIARSHSVTSPMYAIRQEMGSVEEHAKWSVAFGFWGVVRLLWLKLNFMKLTSTGK